MNEWRTIDSAPKDGTDVLARLPDGREVVAHWACDLSGSEQPPFVGWFKELTATCYGGVEPTHWKPQPVKERSDV